MITFGEDQFNDTAMVEGPMGDPLFMEDQQHVQSLGFRSHFSEESMGSRWRTIYYYRPKESKKA